MYSMRIIHTTIKSVHLQINIIEEGLEMDKVILITGASSGIGEAIARNLAGAGARVMLGARRTERLDAIASDIRATGGTVEARALDVTQRAEMTAFVEAAIARWGRIDALVNNAGVMPLSPLAACHYDEWERMVDVNIKGVLWGIGAVLPQMRAQGRGQIINIGSVGALVVSPMAAVYCATKFAVRAISDGLRQESDTIRVTLVNPGVVESELASTITDESAAQAMKEWRRIALQPSAIAGAVRQVIEAPEDVDVNEIAIRPTQSAH